MSFYLTVNSGEGVSLPLPDLPVPEDLKPHHGNVYLESA